MKKAYTLAEILISMVLLTTLSLIAMNTLRNSNGIPNTDLVKFRYVYGTVLDIVNNMSNDQYCYPTENLFAKKPVEGCEFNKKFRSYINVFKDNLIDNSQDSTLRDKLSQTDRNDKISSINTDCFIDNKGITYCLPKLCNNSKTDAACYSKIKDFNLRIYIDKKYTIDRTLYLQISKTGKVTIPNITYDGKINCGSEQQQKSYYQCSLATMLESI